VSKHGSMHEGNLVLEEKLKGRIKRDGPLTFEAFLDVVLYDNEEGYYKEGKRLRKDYCTSPEIHPVFGKSIATCIENIRVSCGRDKVTVIELGGGSGVLADQIVSGSVHRDTLDYFIVERGRKKEANHIAWVSDLSDLPPAEGLTVVLANEFFDALPFHRVVRTEDGLEEVYVDVADGFAEVPGPLSPQVDAFLRSYPLALNLHQRSEVTTRSAQMLTQLNAIVDEGLLLVLDYGYHTQDLAYGRFFDGSTIGYKDFMIREDLLCNLGSIDITHHVNFDHLGAMLRDLGWRKAGEIEQYRFLLNNGILEEMSLLPDSERTSAKMLIDPQGLGSMISALGFTKNLPRGIPGFGPRNSFRDAE
jgi:SAM-dependent MidA family methyltransferase